MKYKNEFYAWGGLYLLCLLFGFLPAAKAGSAIYVFRLILACGFFVPAGLLLRKAIVGEDRKLLGCLRRISLASLIGSFALLVLSILCLAAPDWVGILLQILLNVVDPPLVCGQVYALILFLWACLFFATFSGKNSKKS